MRLISLLRSWRMPATRSTQRRAQRAQPRLEHLEDRWLPSTSAHLDFGPVGATVAPGYTLIGVASYSSTRGYGWLSGSYLKAIDRGAVAGTTLLTEDFVQGKGGTYEISLANGTYDVRLWMGDASAATGTVSVAANGVSVLSNLSTNADQFIQPTFRTTVTNGILTLNLTTSGLSRFALDGLDVVPATTHFRVSTPANAVAGNSFNFTVTALNAYNKTLTSYNGTVGFTSTDPQAALPANSTLSSGKGTFAATLATAGNQTITATDTQTGAHGTSNATAVSPGAATQFAVSAPSSATAGSSFNVTVTALDAYDNTATGYTGTVTFTSSDRQATLPADTALTNGVGTLSAVLATAGNQTITATDTANSGLTRSASIAVSPAAATQFVIGTPATAAVGTAFNYTVTALDAYSNTATGYSGTVQFTSSDALATLPAGSSLANGTGTFSATLGTAGNQTITATDAGGVTGTSAAITVSAGTGIAASFSGPSSVSEGATNAQVAFSNPTGGSGGYTYSYDFGNTGTFEISGSSSATATVPESYVDDAGSLIVHGRITDSAGNHTDYTTSITINDVAPTGVITWPTSLVAGTAATFLASATSPSTADAKLGFVYSWNLGDGATGTGASVSHTFAAAGTYTVTLSTTDADGGVTGTVSTAVTVAAANSGSLSVALSGTASNVGAAVTLVARVSGTYTGSLKYSWTFGDGNTQTGTSPLVSYTYASAGTFTTTVTVTDSAGDQGTGKTTVTATSTPLQPVTLDGTSFGLVGSAVNFSVSNPNLPPAGGFTYAWNFGDGATDSTVTPADSHAYSTAGNYVATVTVSDAKGDKLYASAAVTVNPASSSTDPLYKPVVNANSFSYLGSFALPTSANNWDTAYSLGGLAYRYVNGKLQFFTTNHIYSGGLVYEFNYPGIGTDQNNLPQAQVVTNWGDIYTGKKEFGGDGTLDPSTWTYGLYYDQSSGHLYWTYGNSYNATYLYNPTVGYSTLNNATGVATGVGAWSLANRPEKMDRGGIVQIPQWFANRYTNGATLGVGFGGYFSINATASMGAALAAIAPPNLSVNPNTSALPNIPLLGYPDGGIDRGHRDTQYTSYYDSGSYPGTPGYWNSANGAGYWTWSDTIFDGGTWIDTPTMQGVLFIAKVGQGNVYYQNSDRNAQSGAFEWMVYNPADLAAVASGAKQQWQIQPVYEWTTSTLQFGPYDQQGFGGDGTCDVGGAVFDPTTNRLYVLEEGVLSNGYEAWPEMYVYQVGAPPSTPSSAFVVSDGQSGFSTSSSSWSNTPNGYGGESMQTTTLTTATANWQVAALPPAYYALSVDWNAMPNTNTTAAVYKIYDGTTLVQTVTIDQSQTSSGKVVGGTIFQSLGKFQITSGSLRVVLSNGASASLTADALLVEPSSGP